MLEDLLCFTHLRWNFVYQRPQHLLSRFAKKQRVFVIEEPMFDALTAYNEITALEEGNIWIVTPHIPADITPDKKIAAQKSLLDMLIDLKKINEYIVWYYSPIAYQFSHHLTPELIIYDCMDELSAFKFAPPELKQNEAIVFKKADIVFTGGHHLYEAKKHLHHNIYPFPSSIDKAHFAKAREIKNDPADQSHIAHPRFGFYGVVDERFDIELLEKVATAKPSWQFVIIGPVVKIDPATLPKNSNIHYLGGKDYKELPHYLGGWDVATMPFALNESTKYISPTKTPEYLSGGKPVISTSIRDVVKPYGENNLVHIADTAEDFIKAGETILAEKNNTEWLNKVDAFLANNSWDNTWKSMYDLIQTTKNKKKFLNKRA
jgi:hypothetical protein